MGSETDEYEAERSHLDLIRINFHEFCTKSGIFQLVYMLYTDYIFIL